MERRGQDKDNREDEGGVETESSNKTKQNRREEGGEEGGWRGGRRTNIELLVFSEDEEGLSKGRDGDKLKGLDLDLPDRFRVDDFDFVRRIGVLCWRPHKQTHV